MSKPRQKQTAKVTPLDRSVRTIEIPTKKIGLTDIQSYHRDITIIQSRDDGRLEIVILTKSEARELVKWLTTEQEVNP